MTPDLATLIERLDKNSIPEPNTGCFLWLGSVTRGRLVYGNIGFNGKSIRAHRAAWAAYHGDIPAGMAVCHTCDTPLCINPDHLFLGTKAQNNSDRRAKRRDYWFQNPMAAQAGLARARKFIRAKARGENQGSSKLTDEIVLNIRAEAASGKSQSFLAKKYSITQPTVSALLSRKTWKHV